MKGGEKKKKAEKKKEKRTWLLPLLGLNQRNQHVLALFWCKSFNNISYLKQRKKKNQFRDSNKNKMTKKHRQ